jgi:5-formyltetrahydrofolate cyclo-ligase
MPKSALRTRMLASRHHLSEQEQVHAGDLILATLTAHAGYAAAGTVALYAAFRGEVPTAGLIRHALAAGKQVLLPAVTGNHIEFRRIDREDCLVRGKYGIPEPGPACRPFELDAIDLFVIPGVAFDVQGHRVGYGRGYYDRALHRFESKGKFIGVCYDFQLVEQIVGEPHDVIMDWVITERRVVTPVLLK